MTDRKQISKLELDATDKEIMEEGRDRYFQVDALKAAMIFLVIFDHIVSWGIKWEIGVALWERISIPVFLVILGFNMGLSFQSKGATSLRQLYSKNYFQSKFKRYIVPFLILYGISTIVGLLIYGFNWNEMYVSQYSPTHGLINLFTGILPFWGPGNWFIPLLLQSILIVPILYKGFTKKPILTLIFCFVIEIAMQLLVFFFIGDLYPGGVISWPKVHYISLFMNSILFYLSAVGLGIWFSSGYKLKARRNVFMWILFPISLTYLIAYQFFGFSLVINGVPLLRGDYHFLVFPYSAFLFLLVMIILPQNPKTKFSHMISLIGKSTYHILLTQILGFGMVFAYYGTHHVIDLGFGWVDLLNLPIAWTLFIYAGVQWYKIDQLNNLKKKLLYYIVFFVVFVSIVYLILSIENITY